MIGISANQPLSVSTDGDAGPQIMVPVQQIEDIRTLLDASYAPPARWRVAVIPGSKCPHVLRPQNGGRHGDVGNQRTRATPAHCLTRTGVVRDTPKNSAVGPGFH